MRVLSIIFYITVSNVLFSQKNDYVWPMGNHGGGSLELTLADSIIKEFWPFTLNFNKEPMQIDYFPYRRFRFRAANSSYSRDDGSLFCYTNGMEIFGADDVAIQGGDTINFNQSWLDKISLNNGDKYGFVFFQGMLFLPMIDEKQRRFLYLLSSIYDTNLKKRNDLWYSKIDLGGNGGRGSVVSKDQVISNFEIKDNIQACRHANGRDWWLISISSDNTTYYTYLLDPRGIKLYHTQNIGKESLRLSAGNSTFSQQGDKFGAVDGRYWDSTGVVSIFDFDRCTGLLSNPFFDTLVIPEASVGQGAVFSPDGRYFYANNMNDLYQYDTQDLSKPRVHLATYDGFQSYPDWPGFTTTQFGFWASGPDGRLYNVSGAASAQHMHIMDYPNEQGEACSFRQHALKIPNNPWSIPNFPHYRLGPLDGSSCDTLGLDNHPIAKYRYEADSIQYHRLRFTDLSYFRPETWSWDYGDGSPRESTQSPYHTFPKDGTYHVCLTVSNEHSSNTVCRTITIGTSGSDDIATGRADVSTFPNPVQDYLLVTLGEYVPAHGEIIVYDMSGRIVKTQRIYYGQNNVDMRHLATGVYVWRLMDGSIQIQEGKVVKE